MTVDKRGDDRWSAWLHAILAAGCVVIPCVFTTRVQAVFVVPKLAALWALLAVCFAIIAVAALRPTTFPGGARPVWRVDAAALAFLTLTALAWAFSTDRDQSFYGERLQHQGLLAVVSYGAYFLVARLAVDSGTRLRGMQIAVTVGATIVAGYALIQKTGLDPVWEGYLPGGRVFSSIGQANALAAYLVLALPLAASLVVGHCRSTFRAAAAVAAVAIALALVFTQSRGGYVGVVVALLVLAMGWWRESRIERRHVVVAAAALGVIAGVAVFTGELGRVASHSDESARFHRDAWRVAVEVVEDHPVLGTGPETFPDQFPRYSHAVLPTERAEALDAFRVESPHNVYLAIAAGSGIPALVAYLAAIVGFFAVVVGALQTVTREARIALVAVLAAVAGHLATDAFMTAEVTSTWLFWVLMGGSLCVIAARERERGPAEAGPRSQGIS